MQSEVWGGINYTIPISHINKLSLLLWCSIPFIVIGLSNVFELDVEKGKSPGDIKYAHEYSSDLRSLELIFMGPAVNEIRGKPLTYFINMGDCLWHTYSNGMKVQFYRECSKAIYSLFYSSKAEEKERLTTMVDVQFGCRYFILHWIEYKQPSTRRMHGTENEGNKAIFRQRA